MPPVRTQDVQYGILCQKETRMELSLKSKDTRLYVRCNSPQKTLIEQAAAKLGMSISDYILSTMIERSLDEIQRQNRLLLTQDAFAQLQDLLQTDPEPSPSLVQNM